MIRFMLAGKMDEAAANYSHKEQTVKLLRILSQCFLGQGQSYPYRNEERRKESTTAIDVITKNTSFQFSLDLTGQDF